MTSLDVPCTLGPLGFGQENSGFGRIPIGFPLDYAVPETAETMSKNNVLPVADSFRTFVAANENQNNQLFLSIFSK